MRLFIALPLCEAAVHQAEKIQEKWKESGMQGNWVPSENFHLTLAFIGESDQTAAILHVLNSMALPPITLDFDKAGHFDDLYWIAPKPSETLNEYVYQLRSQLKKAGVAFDEKAFKAHLTLVRKAQVPEGFELAQPNFKASLSHVALMESNLEKGGAKYSVVK
ncbi:MAG: RNA 2',3'-cyclic phosphodiesterase [Ileibacterium sp.]|nr:RNA 2',3'-cyclic phosphodiesterase [Ileibacterium sp.]